MPTDCSASVPTAAHEAGSELRPGTLDDGFNLLAKDLDRAFALGLSSNQAVIMNAIREQSWTEAILTRKKGDKERPDPIPAKLNLSILARSTGLNRSRLSLSLKGLVTGLILAKTAAGFLIRKDYARWLSDDGKTARFTPSQIAFIRDGKRKKKAKPTVAPRNSEVLPIATVEPKSLLQSATPEGSDCCAAQQQVLQSATVGVAQRNSEDSLKSSDWLDSIPLPDGDKDVPLTCGRVRASEDFKTLQTTNTTPPTPSRGEEVVGTIPIQSGNPVPQCGKTAPRRAMPDDAQIDALIDWAREVLTDHTKTPPFDRGEEGFFYGKIRGLCASYDIEWIRDAILAASMSPDLQPRGIGHYVVVRLQNRETKAKTAAKPTPASRIIQSDPNDPGPTFRKRVPQGTSA